MQNWTRDQILIALTVVAMVVIAVATISRDQSERHERVQREDDQRTREEEDARPRIVNNGVDDPRRRPGVKKILLRNEGSKGATAVRRVEFTFSRKFPTPVQDYMPATGFVPQLDVEFNAADFDSSTQTFRRDWSPAYQIPPGENLELLLSINEHGPEWDRQSFEGTVVVYYDKAGSEPVTGVVLDNVNGRNMRPQAGSGAHDAKPAGTIADRLQRSPE